jgi:hypothetical protein
VPAASAVRALPWARILVLARIVVTRLGEDVPPRDRERLAAVLKASKGDPRRLTAAERRDVLRILRQVDVARLSREIAAVGATGKLLRR